MIIDEDDYLAHYGTPRKSGRYPWGSGGNEDGSPRNPSFLDMVSDLRNKGLTPKQIADGLGLESTTQLRAKITIEKNRERQEKIAMANRLKEKGYSNPAIATRMGLPGESSVRALLAEGVKERNDVLISTSEFLKQQVADKEFVDIGKGTENYLGMSKEKLAAATAILKEQGYTVHTVPVPQLGTGQDTRTKVLAPPGTTWGDVRRNQDKIKTVVDFTQFTDDNGKTFNDFKPPLSINPDRVAVNYKETGGDKADGVIYVRQGVPDVSLGSNRYGQVRIQVGDGHYLKGMAVYKDDLPDGVDLVFNTNKSNTGNKLDAMKPLVVDKETGKVDKDLPFGSVVRQILDKPGDPKAKPISAMNLVNEEGKWADWANTLSSQMLSKQSPVLVKERLDTTYQRHKDDFDEIMALTNPTIKKKLLEEFAQSADSSAVHLKAAALPRQANHVILPVSSLKPTEVYAPGYRDGERVVLIRFPHGGTFEIPELTVNNRNREARRMIGTESRDAIGINHKVAQRLSGADFDGDSVLVIPNNSGKIRTSPALDGLKSFDPMQYKLPDDAPRMTSRQKGIEMGNVSNLITDMTIRGASHEQIARAVRHSMVVIDAEKHHLDWRESARKENIAQLKQEYQGRANAGASTLISRKKKTERVPEVRLRRESEGGPVDPQTGRRVFVETGRTTVDREGNRVPRTSRVNLLDMTDDANTLSSGTPVETIYASHSNRLKSLANQARLESRKTPPLRYSPSAAKAHSREVKSLEHKLFIAERNAPRERQAQVLANAKVRAIRRAKPDIEKETLTKLKFKALDESRARMNAGKQKIEVTQEEWNAIQAGAITNNRLNRILTHADIDVIRTFATPRAAVLMTSAKTRQAQQMLANGFTRAEVAARLGVSLSTLDAATVSSE